MMEKLESSLFTWQEWRANEFFSCFGVSVRYSWHVREKVRKAAVGYCKGENLVCRPKENHYAVMLWDGNDHWWTHLSHREFERIFNRET
jgi:hypothetical protein